MKSDCIILLQKLYGETELPFFIIDEKGMVLWANRYACDAYPSFAADLKNGFLSMTRDDNITLVPGKEQILPCSGHLYPIRLHLVPIPSESAFLVQEIPVMDHRKDLKYSTEVLYHTKQLIHSISSSLTPLEEYAQTWDNSKQKERIVRISTNVAKLMNISDHLSKYAQSLQNQFTADLIPAMVSDLLQTIVASIKEFLPDEHIHLHIETEEAAAMVSPRLLAAAVSQLTENALSHNATGNRSDISISLSEDEDHVRISVSDQNGPIDDEILQKIFDPFAKSCSDEEYPVHLGLGLVLVSNIAKVHNGRLLHVKRNDGNTFMISLPKYKGKTGFRSELSFEESVRNAVKTELAFYK